MNKFDQAWCYEIVRLHEHDGNRLDDGHANLRAIETGPPIEKQLLTRALALTRSASLNRSLSDTRRVMRIILLAVWVISFLTGASAGLASLGDGTQPVNVIWAIGALLLLPTTMLLVWLLMFVIRAGSGGWLGHWLEWLAGKFLRKGDTAIAWRAWLRMAARARTHQWWLAFITHTAWFWVLSGMLVSLLLAFSLRHYTFVWQTTWLSEDVFVQFARTVGTLPAQFGFAMPTAADIRMSGNIPVDDPAVRLAWANWLVGALLVFGWIPRLVLAMLSLFLLQRANARYRIDAHDAYALQIQHKLEQLARVYGVDAPPGPVMVRQRLVGIESDQALSPSVVAVLETDLPTQLHAQMPVDTVLLPPVDDYVSRKQTEQRLLELKPHRLLLIADARQTPDRGMMRTILAFGSRAVHTEVYLLHSDDERARVASWEKQLSEINVPMQKGDFAAQTRWLKGLTNHAPE
ncbi:DUF2868 domain-containing protein [Orrella daihaiensis]|uniref:DUF2868 domain-containing protein n=1 Tax=Orrella daihaiensis TaxID=2782176 RepID=A0ABY4AR76_9BURK|nr:DUF2868 domain-containing protein [Orrella daihaiensis]UOD50554.1 DUF2868 domain-containing protein [Orrella daihaiensis]